MSIITNITTSIVLGIFGILNLTSTATAEQVQPQGQVDSGAVSIVREAESKPYIISQHIDSNGINYVDYSNNVGCSWYYSTANKQTYSTCYALSDD